MKNFQEWLEAVALQNQRQLSTGNGGWDNNDHDDDDGGDDDDFENGPWGWKKMEGLNLKLFDWAKTSPAMREIGQAISNHLFEQPPFNEQVRVFPQMAQIEIEWELNIDKWSDMDNQIEAILKKSDLYKPLGVDARELWNVVDKGAVYDYMMYVIILTLTGRGSGRSFLDNQASYYTWQYLQKNWTQQQEVIKAHILDFYHENGMNVQIQLMEPGRSFKKPTGVSQATNHASVLWAKGIAQIQYQINSQVPEDHPDVWNAFGNERKIR